MLLTVMAPGFESGNPDSSIFFRSYRGGTNKLFLKDSYVFAAQGAAGLWPPIYPILKSHIKYLTLVLAVI